MLLGIGDRLDRGTVLGFRVCIRLFCGLFEGLLNVLWNCSMQFGWNDVDQVMHGHGFHAMTALDRFS